ncbi:zona pellucida sperm-binding protein 4-like [Vanacampus margaritifer]
MIKRWSATSFVALALLWCFTGTKVEAWNPSRQPQDLPDPPYNNPYDLQKPPHRIPKPPPPPPKPPFGPSPPYIGPPYAPDHVFPPYIPVGPPPNSETPHYYPWPFLQPHLWQNPPPLLKPPRGNQRNPHGTGPYIYIKPPHGALNAPSWSYHSLDSPSEMLSDPMVPPPWYNPAPTDPFNPSIPDLHNPTGPKPTEEPKLPLIFYDFMPPVEHPSSRDSKPKRLLPRGFSAQFYSQGPQSQQPGTMTPVPHKPGGTDPNSQKCNVPHLRRVQCGRPDISATLCVSTGCCYDGHNCYYTNYQIPVVMGPNPKDALPRGLSDQYYSQAPQPQPPGKKTPIHYQPFVKDPNLQNCDVSRYQRIPCGSPDISANACEAISCCHDGHSCYFGKSVTVQCTKDAQFILVVARDATLPKIDIDTISLMADGPSCTQVDSNSAFSIYQFPVTACGSIVTEEAGKIIYENRMTSSYEVSVGPLGAITRDSNYDLLFQCKYTATSVETLIVELLPLQNPPLSVAALGPINVQLRLGNGQCLTKGCNEVEVAYSSFYTDADYPVSKILRDNVYVEVRLRDRTDPHLVLNLGRCWTTTGASPHSVPQWDILINGCPNSDDRYTAIPVPVGPGSGVDFPSHHRRFIFRMFTFVDPSSLTPQSEHVYIHCSTSVCNAASGQSCEPVCYRRKRDVNSVAQTNGETKIVVSAGPLVMIKP